MAPLKIKSYLVPMLVLFSSMLNHQIIFVFFADTTCGSNNKWTECYNHRFDCINYNIYLNSLINEEEKALLQKRQKFNNSKYYTMNPRLKYTSKIVSFVLKTFQVYTLFDFPLKSNIDSVDDCHQKRTCKGVQET